MVESLFKVTCRGMTSGCPSEITWGVAYVVAYGYDEAAQKVRDALTKRDLGFSKDRDIKSVELVAQNCEYPNAPYVLYT